MLLSSFFFPLNEFPNIFFSNSITMEIVFSVASFIIILVFFFYYCIFKCSLIGNNLYCLHFYLLKNFYLQKYWNNIVRVYSWMESKSFNYRLFFLFFIELLANLIEKIRFISAFLCRHNFIIHFLNRLLSIDSLSFIIF